MCARRNVRDPSLFGDSGNRSAPMQRRRREGARDGIDPSRDDAERAASRVGQEMRWRGAERTAGATKMHRSRRTWQTETHRRREPRDRENIKQKIPESSANVRPWNSLQTPHEAPAKTLQTLLYNGIKCAPITSLIFSDEFNTSSIGERQMVR